MLYFAIINIGWLLLALVWFVSALFAKRSTRAPSWRKQIAVRLIAALAIITIVRGMGGRRALARAVIHAATAANPALHITGVVVFAIGILFAIWARVYLGRNWGVPMSLRQGHELVTSGPYRFVRHPIYTGILLAAIGSALAGELWWLVLLPIFLAYFLYSAFTEEKMMAEQFPSEYPEYKKRTKMLIPFVL
jgi:protein-S-isoprenylcysteine O-methyltransferase Ste14